MRSLHFIGLRYGLSPEQGRGHRKWLVWSLIVFLTTSILTNYFGTVALADAPDPVLSSTSGTAIQNPDGTIALTVQGQWLWSTHNGDCNFDKRAVGYAVDWNDSTQPGNVVGTVQSVTVDVGAATGNTRNPADNNVHPTPPFPNDPYSGAGPFGGCGTFNPSTNHNSGTWGPISHTYAAGTTSVNVCVVVYDVHLTSNGGAPKDTQETTAGGSTHNNDNSVQANANTPLGNGCFTQTFNFTGTINIHKIEDNGAALAGAGFTLFQDNAPTGGTRGTEDTLVAGKSCTTDSTGSCSITNVPLGQYWVVETTTPAGHQTAPDQHVTLTTGGQVVNLTFTDVRSPGTINIHKTSDVPGGGLAGATFTLFVDNAPTGGTRGSEDTITTKTCTTNTSGDCSITNVALGQYWVVETTTPNGYQTAADQNVTLTTGGQVVNLTFNDVAVPGTINIHKVDEIGNAVASATFTLFVDNAPTGGTRGSEDTITTKTCTTDSSGNCSITNVALGRYWVVETTTPAGFQSAPDQNVTIGLGSQPNQGQTVNLTFTDVRSPGTINIHKQDQSGNPLAGATFTLFVDNAPTGGTRGSEDTITTKTCTTNTSGDCSITNVALGQYWVVETTTPAGFQGAADQNVQLTTGGQVINLTFVNTAQAQSDRGFMTGGGEVNAINPTGTGNFGFNASGTEGLTPSDARGHFNYINHTSGAQINGDVTFIFDVDPATTTMQFRVTTKNGCTYKVTVHDNVTATSGGEPGTGDTISIMFESAPAGVTCSPSADQTSGSPTLKHGNIQWHNNVRP